MTSEGIKIAFGAAPIGNRDPWNSTEDLDELFNILDKHGVKILDSAQLYGECPTKPGPGLAEFCKLREVWASFEMMSRIRLSQSFVVLSLRSCILLSILYI